MVSRPHQKGLWQVVTFSCRKQPERVISQRCSCSATLSSFCPASLHILCFSQVSHEVHVLVYCYEQLPDTSLLDQVTPWRLGRLRPLSHLNEPCSYLPWSTNAGWCGHICPLPLLKCSQKTEHPSPFLRYLRTPEGLLIFPSFFFPFSIQHKRSGEQNNTRLVFPLSFSPKIRFFSLHIQHGSKPFMHEKGSIKGLLSSSP